MKKYSLSVICVITLNLFGSEIDYIKKYFPEHSLIRQRHESEGHGFLCFCRSASREACDELQWMLRQVDDEKQFAHQRSGMCPFEKSPTYVPDYLIPTIIWDDGQRHRRKEYEYVYLAVLFIKEEVRKRIQQKQTPIVVITQPKDKQN